MVFIKSIGERDRTTQYDSYVKPISQEEKIVETQKVHKKAQISMSKARRHVEHALSVYSNAPCGSDKVIELLSKEIKHIRELQETMKKKTYNALPYKDLEQERIDEKSFTDNRRKITLKTKLFILGGLANISLYIYGYLSSNHNIIGAGFLFTLIFGGALYFSWTGKSPKIFKPNNKIGPKLF